MATAEASDDDDDTRRLAPPPSYASLASPLVPQQGFEQRAPQTGSLLVHPAFDHAYGDSLHLPRGCFIVRNAAQGKALDLLRHRTDEGAECVVTLLSTQPRHCALSCAHRADLSASPQARAAPDQTAAAQGSVPPARRKQPTVVPGLGGPPCVGCRESRD